jgi:hypothetical protein
MRVLGFGMAAAPTISPTPIAKTEIIITAGYYFVGSAAAIATVR